MIKILQDALNIWIFPPFLLNAAEKNQVASKNKFD